MAYESEEGKETKRGGGKVLVNSHNKADKAGWEGRRKRVHFNPKPSLSISSSHHLKSKGSGIRGAEGDCNYVTFIHQRCARMEGLAIEAQSSIKGLVSRCGCAK